MCELVGRAQGQMIILLMFFTNMPPMILGEFASRAECEQARLEALARETSGRINFICVGPGDRERMRGTDRPPQ